MNRKITVDAEVYEALRTNAIPFDDTPNIVLRRLLGLEASVTRPEIKKIGDAQNARSRNSSRRRKASSNKRSKRANTGRLLAEVHYYEPLLQVLEEMGGVAPSRNVVDAVGERLKNRLTPEDFTTISSGLVRWRNRVQFARLQLVKRGALQWDAPRGTWMITDEGRTMLRQAKENVPVEWS